MTELLHYSLFIWLKLKKLTYCTISDLSYSFMICSELAAKTILKFVDYENILELNRSVNSCSNSVLQNIYTS